MQSIENGAYFDIYVLDIFMPKFSGIEIAKIIRQSNYHAEIIFLTTSSDFSIDAFSVKATHYILKPYTKNEFYDAMDRACVNFKLNETKKIVLKSKGGSLFVVKIDDIFYIEAHGHSLTIYCKDEVRQISGSLLKLLDEFKILTSPNQFTIPFRGYLINQKNIKEISPQEIIMFGNYSIPMAKRKFKEIKNAYFEFLFEEVNS